MSKLREIQRGDKTYHLLQVSAGQVHEHQEFKAYLAQHEEGGETLRYLERAVLYLEQGESAMIDRIIDRLNAALKLPAQVDNQIDVDVQKALQDEFMR